MHQVELGETAQDVRVVVLVIEEALADADVIFVAIFGEQALGSEAEVLDRLLFATLAGVEFGNPQALRDVGDVELGDHAKTLEPLGDLAGLEVRLGDKLVGGDRVGGSIDRVQALGDLDVDIETAGIQAEDLPVDSDRLGRFVVGRVKIGDLAKAIDRSRIIAGSDQTVGEHHPRADVARVGLDDRLVLASGAIVLLAPRVLRGCSQCFLSVERHP